MKPSIDEYVRALAPGLVVFILHGTCGATLGHEPIVDPVSHFLGGCAVAHCVFALMYAFKTQSRLTEMLLALGITALAACCWEFGELASDVLFGTTIQLDAAETLRDEAMGIGGAIMVAATRYLIHLYQSLRAARAR